METNFSHVQGMFKFNTDIVNKAISDIASDHWFQKPGDDSNHLMFLMGHLVVHRGHTLKVLGIEWAASWSRLFARGASQMADSEYPSIAEIKEAWEHVSAELSKALSEPLTEVLSQNAPKGPPSFDGKAGGTVAFFAFHDTYHVGQISYLRKWLGYGQTVG